MELAEFLIACRFRRGQMTVSSARVFLLYRVFLPLARFLLAYCVFPPRGKRPLRRRECLAFHVPCHREPGVDSSPLCRADSAIDLAKPFPSETWQPQAIQPWQGTWPPPGRLLCPLLSQHLWLRLLSRLSL